MRLISGASPLAICLLLITSIPGALAEDALPKLEIEEIQPGVYLHKSYQRVDGWGVLSTNGLVVVREDEAFLVDTPWSASDTEDLIGWIKEQGWTAIGSVSTHSHEDTTAGVAWLNSKSIPTYASGLTNLILGNMGKAQATNTLESTHVALADGLVEAFYPGPGHTVDNIVVWLPEAEILYGGCFIRSLSSEGLGYTGEASMSEWPNSVDAVLDQFPSAQIIVPGHGKEGDISLLNHTKTLAQNELDDSN